MKLKISSPIGVGGRDVNYYYSTWDMSTSYFYWRKKEIRNDYFSLSVAICKSYWHPKMRIFKKSRNLFCVNFLHKFKFAKFRNSGDSLKFLNGKVSAFKVIIFYQGYFLIAAIKLTIRGPLHTLSCFDDFWRFYLQPLPPFYL